MISKNLPKKKPLICLITEGKARPENFQTEIVKILKIIKTAVGANISLIQIREKNIYALQLFKLAKEAVKIAANSQTKIIINDRVDIALAAGADGVHLSSESIPAGIIRQNFKTDFIIGVSAHTLAEVEKAKNSQADFAYYSPIFSTPAKSNPKGIKDLSNVCKTVYPFSVIGLGGINETNFRDILASGAAGFAAIRFLNNKENLEKITKELL